MKIFTKILTGVVLISLFSNTYSQDVGVILYVNVNNNDMFYPGDTLTAEIHVNNLGATTIGISDYDSLPVTLYANGKGVAGTFFGGQPWPMGQVYIMTMSPLVWGNHNIDSGIVSICTKTYIWKNSVNIDIDQGNDELCLPNVIYIGPPGTGIVENGKLNVHIYYFDAKLTVLVPKGIKDIYTLNISDISGRLVNQANLDFSKSGRQSVDLSQLNSGIYIAHLRSSEGARISQKFLVN